MLSGSSLVGSLGPESSYFCRSPKKKLKRLTSLLTGHCDLRACLCKMRKAKSEICRLCTGARETAEHILCFCEAASAFRLRILEEVFPSPQVIWASAPTKVLKFFSEPLQIVRAWHNRPLDGRSVQVGIISPLPSFNGKKSCGHTEKNNSALILLKSPRAFPNILIVEAP